jgi:hypothetical protein
VEGIRELYQAGKRARAATAAGLSGREGTFAWMRLAVFAAGALLAVAVVRWEVPALWLFAPAVLFLALVVAHARTIEARERTERAIAFYDAGLARLDGTWAGSGSGGERFLDPHHPYAADLDLFGRGSLFQRLSAARTRMGEEVLAGWLLAPASPAEVRERQQAVTELKDRLDLREDLAVLSSEVEAGVDAAALRAWAEAPVLLWGRGRIVALLAVAATLATLALWWGGWTGPWPFLLAAAIESGIGVFYRSRVRRVDGAVEKPGQDLELLASVLARFERERFQAPLLARLRDALRAGETPPSEAVRRLSRLVALLDSRRNQLFAPFAYLFLWGTQLGFAVEAWRARQGAAIGRWIDAVGTLEALSSLAAHAFENPDDPFPELLEGARAHLEAEGLAHPLLPPATAVRNDVAFGTGNAIPQVLLVSGSNMSGKSTLLRAVGINAVLAQAGAPVRARRLRMTALAVGATLRIQDSLQEGTSRFFAEVQRLSDLVKLSRGERPLLFLLDEILHGTNSHDRRLGAEGIVRGLLARGAIGLVTTHDLALAAIAEELGPAAANVHFEDRLEGGRLVFDYTLRPGVVRRSNALELMRSVGLEVCGDRH